MKKLAIIINGSGGAGKDTLCEISARKYSVINVSTITPIKSIARENGWNGEKTPKARKFLAELKRIFTEYNDLPNRYALGEYKKFISDGKTEIMFIHIRESDQIERFLKGAACFDGCNVITLLIRSNRLLKGYGNRADDDVENYNYDYLYENNLSLDEAAVDFICFLDGVFEAEASETESL